MLRVKYIVFGLCFCFGFMFIIFIDVIPCITAAVVVVFQRLSTARGVAILLQLGLFSKYIYLINSFKNRVRFYLQETYNFIEFKLTTFKVTSFIKNN